MIARPIGRGGAGLVAAVVGGGRRLVGRGMLHLVLLRRRGEVGRRIVGG